MKKETKDLYYDQLMFILAQLWDTMQDGRLRGMNKIRDFLYHIDKGIPYFIPQAKKGEKEEDLPDYGKEYADALLPGVFERLKSEGRLTSFQEKAIDLLFEGVGTFKEMEKKYMKQCEEYLSPEPIYTSYLEKIRGVGASLGVQTFHRFGYCDKTYHEDVYKKGILVHKKGDDKIPYPSSLCEYAGYGDIETSKRELGKKRGDNPKAKTLVWKIVKNLIKGKSPIFAAPPIDIYHSYKKLIEGRLPRWWDVVKNVNKVAGDILVEDVGPIKGGVRIAYPKRYKGKGIEYERLVAECEKRGNNMVLIQLAQNHIDNMAIRKVGQVFLVCYWLKARQLKGLPVTVPWAFRNESVAKHSHLITPEDIIKANEGTWEEKETDTDKVELSLQME